MVLSFLWIDFGEDEMRDWKIHEKEREKKDGRKRITEGERERGPKEWGFHTLGEEGRRKEIYVKRVRRRRE